MNELWKEIPGSEGRYMVSDEGHVKSFAGGFERIMKPHPNSNGYLRVCLRFNGSTEWMFVHRLVAELFIPNPHGFPIINHKDENPLNNNADNLEWCTYSYNTRYSNVGVRINKDRCHALRGVEIATGHVLNFESLRSAERMGFHRRSIQKCLSGKFHHHKGYKWSLV